MSSGKKTACLSSVKQKIQISTTLSLDNICNDLLFCLGFSRHSWNHLVDRHKKRIK